MSYILDALKKSQSNPGGSTLNIDPIATKQDVPAVWIWSLGLVLAINIFAIGWFLTQPTTEAVTTKTDPPPTQTQPTVVRTAAPALLQTGVVASATRVEAKQTEVVSTPRIVEMKSTDLKSAEQQRFKALKFTSHIYTDDPTLCAVVIDGQRLKNGDRFDGMIVYEITELGVVFAEQIGRDGSQMTRHIEVRPFE